MPQTSVTERNAFAGQIADLDFPTARVTATNQEGAAIPFGIAVTLSASQSDAVDSDVEEFDAAADKVFGVVVREHTIASDDLAGTDAVENDEVCAVMRQGRIWVTVEDAVVKDAPVYVRHTSDGGSNTQLGSFRSDVDSNRARRMKGAKFASAAGAGELAILEFNCSNEDNPDEVLFTYTENNQLTGDTTRELAGVPSGRVLVIQGGTIRNVTGLALDGSNYFNIKVQHGTGPTVALNHSTETVALAADTEVAMTAGTLANRTILGGAKLQLMFDETGTATLPTGTVVTVTGILY